MGFWVWSWIPNWSFNHFDLFSRVKICEIRNAVFCVNAANLVIVMVDLCFTGVGVCCEVERRILNCEQHGECCFVVCSCFGSDLVVYCSNLDSLDLVLVVTLSILIFLYGGTKTWKQNKQNYLLGAFKPACNVVITFNDGKNRKQVSNHFYFLFL